MIIKIKQINKELFSAEFDILENENKIGKMVLKGQIGTMGGNWQIEFKGEKISIEKILAFNKSKRFRPHSIEINREKKGEIYQTLEKISLFKSLDFHRLEINDKMFDIFPIGMGEIVKSPVYCENKQVALVEKNLTVYNDLHEFDIFAIDDESTLASLLMCCYMYTIGYYKPGEKIIEGVHKGYSLCKEKELLAKYNPKFKLDNFNVE